MLDMLLLTVRLLWPMILLAAVPMAFTGPAARFVFLVLGLLFFFAVSASQLGSTGLHGEAIVFAIPGLAISAAAVVAELLARVARSLRRKAGEPC
jgi:hypothetical protein